MTDVLDVVAQSRHSLLAIGLPEATVVAVNDAAAELLGESAETLVGRRATSLYRGADEVRATIALSAMATGAIDSYSAQRRLATSKAGAAWVSVRKLELQDVTVAIQRILPPGEPPPLDGVEEELAAVTGVGWASHAPQHESIGPEGVQRRVNGSIVEILDGLSLRQRQIVAALAQGDRTPAIAAALFVSNSTVRSHLSAIFKAFGVGSQTELLSLLRRRSTDRRGPPT
jgi:DNA-binding NarL/FixJ family response regulator